MPLASGLLVSAVGRAERLRIADAAERSPPAVHIAVDARLLPFTDPPRMRPAGGTPVVLRIDDLELAFPDHQASRTRLVLTGSIYLLQKLVDALRPDDRIVATAAPALLKRKAPEALERRGPWRLFDTIDRERGNDRADADVADIALSTDHAGPSATPGSVVADRLAIAYAMPSADERLALCLEVVDISPDSAMARLALASAFRERQDLTSARFALDRTLQLAPDWEAAHYESGKLWLVEDDMEQARRAFQRAADLMPTFAAAHSNLGAACGELGDHGAALAAFSRALVHDPTSHTILNNVGVVNRELGRLTASEEALTRVIALAPAFVFGHYNLGHTRFLRGDYPGALAAYEDGQRRDPERNRRQGCRLAMVRFANGDVARARQELLDFTTEAAPEEREDLLLEARDIAEALVEAHPELAHHHAFVAWIGSQVAS